MTCPVCGGVVRTAQSFKDCEGVYRQRKCIEPECGHIFYTTEVESDGSDYRRLMRESLDRLNKQYRRRRSSS